MEQPNRRLCVSDVRRNNAVLRRKIRKEESRQAALKRVIGKNAELSYRLAELTKIRAPHGWEVAETDHD